jgi:hypothetical protein
MQQRSTPSKTTDVPLSVRIMPSRLALWAGFAAGVALVWVFGWLARDSQGQIPIAIIWIVVGLSALASIGSGLRLLLQLPLIEASELGIAVWLYGSYRRPFFVPWSRVRAIALTRVRRANSTTDERARDALGIELHHDNRFEVPRSATTNEVPVDGAARADLAWSSRSISGDLRRWVGLLQTMKDTCEDSPPR